MQNPKIVPVKQVQQVRPTGKDSAPKITQQAPQAMDNIESFLDFIGFNKPVQIEDDNFVQVKPQKKTIKMASQKKLNSKYLEFFSRQYPEMKKRFPNRSQVEISKVVGLLWKREQRARKEIGPKKVREIKKQIRKSYSVLDVRRNRPKQFGGVVSIGGLAIPVPQKPQGSYLKFFQHQKKLNPKLTTEEITTQWKNLSDAEKEPWIKETLEDQKLFQRLRREFIQKYDFFPKHMSRREKRQLDQYKADLIRIAQEKKAKEQSEKQTSTGQQTQQSFQAEKSMDELVREIDNLYPKGLSDQVPKSKSGQNRLGELLRQKVIKL